MPCRTLQPIHHRRSATCSPKIWEPVPGLRPDALSSSTSAWFRTSECNSAAVLSSNRRVGIRTQDRYSGTACCGGQKACVPYGYFVEDPCGDLQEIADIAQTSTEARPGTARR